MRLKLLRGGEPHSTPGGNSYEVWVPDPGNPDRFLRMGVVRRADERQPFEFVGGAAPDVEVARAALRAVEVESAPLEGVTLNFYVGVPTMFGPPGTRRLLESLFKGLAEGLCHPEFGGFPELAPSVPEVWMELDDDQLYYLRKEKACLHFFRRFLEEVENVVGPRVRHVLLHRGISGVFAPNTPRTDHYRVAYDTAGLPRLVRGPSGWCDLEVLPR